MAGKIKLELLIPEREVFRGEVEAIIAPGIAGSLGILPGHCPLLTELDTGPLRIIRDGEELQFALSRGFLEVRPGQVTILADTAEAPGEIDVARAEEAYRRAREQLRQPERYDIARARAKLHRAMVRLQVAKHGARQKPVQKRRRRPEEGKTPEDRGH